MPRIAKGELAAARSNLAGIRDLAMESGNWDAGAARYHAPMANRAMTTLAAGGEAPPDWALKNRKFLEGQGWRFPYGKWL